ncbi:unnamed protein product [Candida verbasci]|uniref:Sorting nexin-4 n=1 Tax=Candida verbasci TaxID=1227364 RepID=A0A9W4TTW4_9ASCO|nr:unnamed protein product [Candida verbasci]
MASEDQFTSIQWDRDEIDQKKDLNDNDDNEDLLINFPIEEEQESLNEPNESNLKDNDNEHDDNQPASNESNDDPSNSLIISSESQPPKAQSPEPQPPKPQLPKPQPQPTVQPTTTEESDLIYSIDTSFFDKYAIKSSVTHPNRDLDTNSKPFISYLITTTTNHPELLKLSKEKKLKDDYLTITVRRRYGDFRYLYESLNNDFPTVLIPPLPSKSNFKYLTGDTFSIDFVNKRLHSLDRFIRFITQHRILSQSSIFHLFLSDSNDWSTFTTSLKIKDINESESGGIINKVVNEEITDTVMNFLTSSKHKKETNKDILEINDKLKKLYENLLKLNNLFTKSNKKHLELSHDYELFSQQILKLSNIKNDDSEILNNFKFFSESLDFFAKSWNQLYKHMDESFLVSLKDCSRYIIQLKNLIELLQNKNIDLKVLQDYLKKARNELNAIGKPQSTNSSGINRLIHDTISTSATPTIGSQQTDNKINKLENKVKSIENEIEKQIKLVGDLTNQIINQEFPNFKRFTDQELKNSMINLADENIKFYKNLIEKFDETEIKLKERLDRL